MAGHRDDGTVAGNKAHDEFRKVSKEKFGIAPEYVDFIQQLLHPNTIQNPQDFTPPHGIPRPTEASDDTPVMGTPRDDETLDKWAQEDIDEDEKYKEEDRQSRGLW